MAKFLSDTQQSLKVGISSYTENKTVLQTIGKVGIGTTNAGGRSLYVIGDVGITGVSTLGSLNATSIVGTALSISGISTLGVTTVTNLTARQLNVSGISTLQSTTLIGGGTSTGTANQVLQVTGGAYISTSTGIGTTNPSRLLDANGDVRLRGAIYDSGNSSGSLNEVLSSNGSGVWSWKTVNAVGGANIAIANDTTNESRFLVFTNISSGSTATEYVSTTGLVFNPSSGNLGIGSTLPTSKLSVEGNARVSGVVTATTFSGQVNATNIVGTALSISVGFSTLGVTTVTNLTSQQLNVSGVSTVTTLNATNIVGTALSISGISTLGVTTVTNLTARQLNVSGISTLQSTTLIGGGTSTGTANQVLQVTGISSGAYIGGSVGIGTTNPTSLLQVQGNTLITGIATVNSNFVVNGNTLIVDTTNNRVGILTATPIQPFQVGAAGTNVFLVNSTGSVGIGTTNPLQNLHVLGNVLVAAGSSTGQHITQKPYELNSGTLSWEGSAGQLFSITNNLTSGSIFSVNDVSGIPSIDVDANGTIQLAAYGGSVGIGTTNPVGQLQVSSGPVIIGTATSTGTASQAFQVGSPTNVLGAYVSGNLGVGITNPTSQLHVFENLASGYAAIFDNDGNNANRFGIRIQCGVDTGAGTAIAIDDGDGTNQGNVTFNAGTVTYGTFTANHDCIIPSYSGEIPYGTLLSINEIVYKHKEDGTVLPRGIIYSVGIASTSYSKNLLGAYSYQYDSSSPAQQGVDGPVHQVLVLGDGHIRCCGENGNIKLGDGITSSSTEGVGMKMDKIGVVIGIAQENVDFVSPSEIKLVPVQYGLHQYVPDNIAEYIENLMNT